MADPIQELRRYSKEEGKLIIGTDRTLKYLKLGKIEKVYLAKNVPEEIEEDIRYYSKLAGTEVVKLDLYNDDLGAVVGKPFRISVIGLLRSE